MNPQRVDAEERAARWGGAALAIGASVYALAVIAYVVLYSQPGGTGPNGERTLADRVAHLEARWHIAGPLWAIETAAAVLVAIGAFVLSGRTGDDSRIPARFSWTTAGVGAILLGMMYPFMLGAYPAALAAFQREPGLFAIVQGTATFFFNLGNAVVFAGFAGAFRNDGLRRTLRRGIALAGSVVCIISALTAAGMLMGVDAMAAAAPLGLIGFVLVAYLGFAIWNTKAFDNQ